jgi:metal-dependent amidase/aminoacylase/carboxypeptidase family protein
VNIKVLESLKNLTEDLVQNAPLAERYESFARQFGVEFPSRQEQEGFPLASTDQGDVSYEIPAIQALFRIDVPPGVGNHTPAFADVCSWLM